MTGKRIVVAERRTFTFALQGNQSQTTIIDRAVDVLGGKEAVLQVAVHAITWSSGASLRVTAAPVQIVASEPQTDFVSTTGVATATLESGVAAGQLVSSPLSAGFGSHLRIAIFAQQPASPVTLSCTITVIVTLKD